jgi:hypothetical protein
LSVCVDGLCVCVCVRVSACLSVCLSLQVTVRTVDHLNEETTEQKSELVELREENARLLAARDILMSENAKVKKQREEQEEVNYSTDDVVLLCTATAL